MIARVILRLQLLIAAVSLSASDVPRPPAFVLAAPGDGVVALHWERVPEATSYEVWRAGSDAGVLTLIASGLVDTRLNVSNLNNNGVFFFAVASSGIGGAGVSSARARAVPSAPVLDLLPAGAKVERLATGFQFIEGPVWMPGGYLVFSDIPANRLYRWTPGAGHAIFRANSGQANGNTLDREGRLVSGEQANRRVSRTEPDGAITPLITRYNGKAFNAPNDVVVKSDGSVWFTDPNYGLGQLQPRRYVFRFHPTNVNETLITVATNFDQPNGLCFSPDESRLYIADSGGPAHVRVFDVQSDNTLANSRVFTKITAGVPDGLRTDATGRVLVTTSEGVHIFSPAGQLQGKIRTPETAANVGFGGLGGDALFITANTSLYGISRLPDLVVSSVKPSAALVAGRDLSFHVLVKNQGTGLVPGGVGVRVTLSLDGVAHRFQTRPFQSTLPPDATIVMLCDGGPLATIWRATAGTHTILATVDDLRGVSESIEANNTLTNKFTVAAAPLDTDGDGASDDNESVAGTDSTDSASVLRILSAQQQTDGAVVLIWTSVPGRSYRVACQATLGSPEWVDVSQTVLADGARTSWTNPPFVASRNFLRVRVVP